MFASNRFIGAFVVASIFTFLTTSSIAAPKTSGKLDAIWESYGVGGKTKTRKVLKAKRKPKKIVKRLTPQQIRQRRTTAQKKHLKNRPEKRRLVAKKRPSSSYKKQYEARFRHDKAILKQRQHLDSLVKRSHKKVKITPNLLNNNETRLARQRLAWKTKWDAEQRAKKQKQVQTKRSVPRTQKVKIKKSPKKLTRAQYQWRFKQAQLKKQQQAKKPVKKKVPLKQFKASQQGAFYNQLPMEIIAKLRAAGVGKSGMSAYVQDVNSPKPLLAYQDKTSRVPASVMKLITSYAALGTLGSNYRWPLDIYTQGNVKNNTLVGDLIVKGYGAPDFDTNELRKVMRKIRQKGIRNVTGRIIFDNSYFSIPHESAAAFDGKGQASYNAQPDALLFNERLNTFQVSARGRRVNVKSLTPTHNLKIVNNMRKTRRGCRPRITVSKKAAVTVVRFSGKYSSRCGTRTYTRVISRPAEMIYGSMRAMWKREVGGTLKTQFAMGRAPQNAKPFLRTYSRTLAQILPTIDKDSNNVMARQLLLTIGAKLTGQGTPRTGANAVGQWLASRGLHFPELRIENGSGLSRVARISARHVGDLLVDAYRSPYRNHLMQSLAVAGVDGTMKRRLRGTAVRGRGFFKTGTLKNVRSIAGYVKARNGKTYVMSILHNDPKARSRSLGAHNKLIEWVFAGGRSNEQLALR